MTFIIGTIVDRVVSFRVSEEAEEPGLDVVTHAETGYELGPGGKAQERSCRAVARRRLLPTQATRMPTGA